MISLRVSWSARRSVSFCLTAFTSRGSVSRPPFSTISNSIVAVVVSSTFMGVLLLWADEKLEILVPLARRGRNDAAVQEVAHDAVGRRPVVAVAGFVVAADLRCAERGLGTLHAERHQRSPARSLDPSIISSARSSTMWHWPLRMAQSKVRAKPKQRFLFETAIQFANFSRRVTTLPRL